MPEFTVEMEGTSVRQFFVIAETWERAKELAELQKDGEVGFLTRGEVVTDEDFYTEGEEVVRVTSLDDGNEHYNRTRLETPDDD